MWLADTGSLASTIFKFHFNVLPVCTLKYLLPRYSVCQNLVFQIVFCICLILKIVLVLVCVLLTAKRSAVGEKKKQAFKKIHLCVVEARSAIFNMLI